MIIRGMDVLGILIGGCINWKFHILMQILMQGNKSSTKIFFMDFFDEKMPLNQPLKKLVSLY